jgi:hypothetical protein
LERGIRPRDEWIIKNRLHFPRSIPAVLRTFETVYHSEGSPLPGYRLVGLQGQLAEAGMVYPWQLSGMQKKIKPE